MRGRFHNLIIGAARTLLFPAGALLWACATAPAPAAAERIVAVGDLHGDYDAYLAIIKDAGLVNSGGNWSAGDAVFVQTGDVPDRGPGTRKIIRHLMKLEKQARREGGRVVALIGNHEAMNMTGDLRYTTPEEFDAFRDRESRTRRNRYFENHREELRARYGAELPDAEVKRKFEAEVPLGYIEHRLAWSRDGEIGEWILTHDAVALIDGTLFSHGGISPSYAATPIGDINNAVRDALDGTGDATILTDEQGPLWYRGNATETETGGAEVDQALANFGADRLVVGHTPQLDGIKTLYGGKVIVIDTGASAAMGGVRSWLEIENGTATAHGLEEGDVQ